MPTFTVKKIKQEAAGESSLGPWTRQKLLLANGEEKDKVATLFCGKYTPIPEVGQQLTGEIVPRDGTVVPELKLERKQGGGGFRGKPVEERRSIAMQHAQKCAVDILHHAQLQGDLSEWVQAARMTSQALFEQVVEAEKTK